MGQAPAMRAVFTEMWVTPVGKGGGKATTTHPYPSCRSVCADIMTIDRRIESQVRKLKVLLAMTRQMYF